MQSLTALADSTTTASHRPVPEILETWGKVGGHNLIIDAKIADKLTVKANQLSPDGLVHGVVDSVHGSIKSEARNITRVVPGPVHWSTDLTLESSTMRQALERNGVLENEATPENANRAKVSVFVRGASGRHMIDALEIASRPMVSAKPKPRKEAGK
ncbi:MAG: hypothetical protein ACI9S9_001383 [Planctomycetota bacterium]|jgi:hypothetical protein